MHGLATNGASGKESGNLEHLRVQYARRRTELARRMAEAPTRTLAGAYLEAIKELDDSWLEATGTPPPKLPEPVGPEPKPSGRQADTAGSVAAAVAGGVPEESAAREGEPTATPGLLEGRPSAHEPGAGEEKEGAPQLTATGAHRWRLTRSRVMVLAGGVVVLGWLATGVVWVGKAGSGRIIRAGQPVRAVFGPLALKWPWPIERFRPAEGLETIDPGIESDPRMAAADAEAARRGAATLRAAYQRLKRGGASDMADGGRAEELMRRAAQVPKAQAGALYRQAASEFVRAMTMATIGDAQVAITRWDSVPASDRQRWQPRVAEASARLDEGMRQFAEGRHEDARQAISASAAALESIWNEYMGGLLASARSALATALAEWDLAVQTLLKAGMSDPEPVFRARAALAADDGEAPGQARLGELRDAHAAVGAAIAQYREEQAQFLAARQVAEQAREAFRQARKPEFAPDVSQADALMERAPEALRAEGPRSATAIYRQAASEYTGAVALAAAGMAAQAQTRQRAAAAELQTLRRGLDSLTEARAGALRRAVKAAGRLEELRAQAPGADSTQAGAMREHVTVAEAELAHADRVVWVLERAGITDERLGALEASFQSVRQALDRGGDIPAVPPEVTAEIGRLGRIIGLVDGAVRAESAAQASAGRWSSVAPETLARWQGWLQNPLARLQSGVRTLEAGEIEQATQVLEAARQSLDSLWEEFLAESVLQARQAADLALAQWSALTEPLAKLAPPEPEPVREARSLLESASSAERPAAQRVEMLRRAASLLSSASAAMKEQRATINIPGPDGRTPLLRAVAEGDALVVESMLARGADVNIPGSDGETALVITVRAGRADLAWMLLAAGADRNGAGADGTPLVFLSAHSPATLQLFLEEAGRTRYRGRTILHEIARAGVERKVKGADQVKMAGMVLDKFPALLRQRDSLGLTALELARQRSASELALFLTQRESK